MNWLEAGQLSQEQIFNDLNGAWWREIGRWIDASEREEIDRRQWTKELAKKWGLVCTRTD
jgi:hypothetical protein